MKRVVVCFFILAFAANPALAGSQASASKGGAPDHRCDSNGPGFFAIKGSDACFRIGGYIGADAVLASGPRSNINPALNDGGVDSNVGVSGEIVFETPLGPSKITVGTRRGFGRSWASDNQ